MAGDIRVRGKWAGTWVGVGQELWGGPRILGGVLSISLFIHFLAELFRGMLFKWKGANKKSHQK